MTDHLRVTNADERTSGWEDYAPTFRVYVHELDDDGAPDSTDVYDLTGADILDAFAWAQAAAGGTRAWSIALLSERPGYGGQPRLGLTWLFGMDGIDTPADGWEGRIHSRMMEQVGNAIHIPAAEKPEG